MVQDAKHWGLLANFNASTNLVHIPHPNVTIKCVSCLYVQFTTASLQQYLNISFTFDVGKDKQTLAVRLLCKYRSFHVSNKRNFRCNLQSSHLTTFTLLGTSDKRVSIHTKRWGEITVSQWSVSVPSCLDYKFPRRYIFTIKSPCLCNRDFNSNPNPDAW
jgi:hypothetical protein